MMNSGRMRSYPTMTKTVRISDRELRKLLDAYGKRTDRWGHAGQSDVLNALAGTPGFGNVLSDLR